MSTGSLSDSLTSPSPSPPPRMAPTTRRPGRPKKPPKKAPPPVRAPKKGESIPKAPPSAGLETTIDSGSELSELTEDEEGNAAKAHSQEGGSVVDDDQMENEQSPTPDDDDGSTQDAKKKGRARASSRKEPSNGRPTTSSGSNGAGKRKRSSIIPPTMWGWAAPGTTAEEEEDERSQPQAMEEESDSEQEAKERDDTEEADERLNGMQVDDVTVETAPIETAAAATLLDLLAVASPEMINGEVSEEEVDVEDPPVVTSETVENVKRIARRASAARTPLEEEEDDRPVSPISQDGEVVDGPSREVSPVSGDEDPEPEAADKSDIEVDAPDKSDVEDEAKSDDDADMEMDVQPAHRAEALDVLANIELKFSLTRRAIFLDRMEGLAWEEALVQAGTHPEMLHIQRELMARRDRRIELATRKRSFECADAERKRVTAEQGVWSWWKLSRDDLQTDMITETNRKRRKMERDRRGSERSVPLRRSIPPAPPSNPSLPPLDLRRILRGSNSNSTAFVFPDVSSLSATEIEQDLSYMSRQSQPAPPPPIPHDLPPPSSHRHPAPNRMMMQPSQQIPAPQPMYDQAYQRPYHPPPPQVGPGYARTHQPLPPHMQHHSHPPPQGGFELDYRTAYPPSRRPESPGPRWGKPGANEWSGSETRVIGGEGRIEQQQGRVIGMGMPMARLQDDDERERMMKRERDRDRDRDRELHDVDRRDYGHLHRTPHHSIAGPHHHHHHHGPGVHHHVVHHHHTSSTSRPSSSHLPRPSLSPRASREFDSRSSHNDRPPHQAELINISSKSSSTDRYERDPDYRKRVLPPPDDRDRPIATPFVMGGSYGNNGPAANRSMRTPPPVNSPAQPNRASSRSLEDAFRMPPSSSTSVSFLGESVQSHRPSSHPSSPRRYSQTSQGPPLPAQSSSTSRSSTARPSGFSPPMHRALPSTNSPAFGGGGSRYPNGPLLAGARAPTPSRSPVLHRAERLPSPPPSSSSNKMMVGAMMNGPLPPSYPGSSRTTTPTVTSEEKGTLRNDSPFVGPFAGINNPAPSYVAKPPNAERDRDNNKVDGAGKTDKMPPRVSPPPPLAPPPSVLPPLPTQLKSERIQ
ncbi:hypothetical protein MIND_00233100 [Mycena indigotica]|uniref:Uncharacterized protein n=1 Tax=Mycena indigotica TaxID=2126181 RepID=A0A8H6T8C1_9AGAR|nr:uncharacterized protein MIND_00233100 [Mycena indigotica]KAF7312202.1 hypothetical protein MIND_00233100 [Mycena indigotica]